MRLFFISVRLGLQFVLAIMCLAEPKQEPIVNYYASDLSEEFISQYDLGDQSFEITSTTFVEEERLSVRGYALVLESLSAAILKVDSDFADPSVKNHFYQNLIERVDLARLRLLVADDAWLDFKRRHKKLEVLYKVYLPDGDIFFVKDPDSGSILGSYRKRNDGKAERVGAENKDPTF